MTKDTGEYPLLTIFTPAYNRQELLKRAYESLTRQTRKDFVWLIVDDGSTDDTAKLIRGWQEAGVLSIEYYHTENGGKMRAHNLGVKYTKTLLFLCLDSDDYLTEDAVEIIYDEYGRIEEAADETVRLYTGKQFGGFVAHKGRDEKTPLYGEDFPKLVYSTLYGLYLKGFHGETTLVYRTEVLRSYPFPEISGEKYVPEDYIYDKIDRNYVLKVIPRVLTVCELTQSGYTESLKKLKRENPVGWYLYYRQRLKITPLFDPPLLKFKYAGYYVIYKNRAAASLSGKAGGRELKGTEKQPRGLSERTSGASEIPFLWVLMGVISAFLLKMTGRE
ncbi:MAG: glycosyltransferase family 2 protein [Lachnospiraceae bacterium]|nr:glycosyltransferase family 2 protein [Lachnospiraceae bacterium]